MKHWRRDDNGLNTLVLLVSICPTELTWERYERVKIASQNEGVFIKDQIRLETCLDEVYHQALRKE